MAQTVLLRLSCVANTARAVWGEIGGKLGLTWTVFWGAWKGMGSVGECGGVDVGDLLDTLMEWSDMAWGMQG
jgi:hypothetical protein